MRNSSSLERRLNRHAPVILVGGLFFTLSALFFLTMCNMPCEDKLYGLDADVLKAAKSKAFWKEHFLSPHRDLKAKLVILVLTGPENFQERDGIRETWMSDLSSLSVLIRFVIGSASLSVNTRQKIDREQLVHEDLLILNNVQDSYQGLTFKVLQAFVWLDQNVDFQYVLKVDDDSFVRVSNVLAELQHKPKDRLYWGFFDGRARVKTSGKWKETDWNLCDRYLPYARGGGYVLSSDLVHFIASNQEFFQLYLSEDVSVGAWLAPLKINRHHDQNFDTEYISRGCLNSYLVTHKQTVLKLRELHTNLRSLGHLCKSEVVERASYEYDWSFPPSKCCQRPEGKPMGKLAAKPVLSNAVRPPPR
ncbi:beta-1,3-galactosyltransferase 6 [Aplysia californica]|uniref:Hexosyltransferase n=1 Tax=Aplysia californica TaxID=6500 RepID=A0ABM0K5C3_APLCA|nr:beta-1,3-galactosyltransferase 6 [Aplysia californica]